jgi:hypothetical protein
MIVDAIWIRLPVEGDYTQLTIIDNGKRILLLFALSSRLELAKEKNSFSSSRRSPSQIG